MADTGHANNVAAFEELVSICAALGGQYKPSNADLEIGKIQTQHTETEDSFNAWGDDRAGETLADTNRENAFKSAGPLITAGVNYYDSTDAPDNRKVDAKEFRRKWRGERAKKVDPNNPKTIEAAQTSYVQRVAHISGLIDLWTADGFYSPNEDPIKLAAFVTVRDALADFNTGSMTANTNTASSRSSFFVKAYTGENNMVDTAMQIKKYLKALLGPSNIIYKQAAGLKFTRPKV